MRRTVLLLASAALAMLLASGVGMTQETDTTPPDTVIFGYPAPFDNDTTATFNFYSTESDSTFECNLDGGSFRPCTDTEEKYFGLAEGPHAFAVRAKDASGNVDPTPGEYAWEVDTTDPTMTWEQMPGSGDGVTDDRTPTFAWAFSDKNLRENDSTCDLSYGTGGSPVVGPRPCPSPTTFPFDLADGVYTFGVSHYDKAFNVYNSWATFEVDTVAPRIASVKPTGRRVWRHSEIIVTLNDKAHDSKEFVNIYRKGASRPMGVFRFGGNGSKKIGLIPNPLKRDTWYTVKVTTGVNDGANNLKSPYAWSFKTE